MTVPKQIVDVISTTVVTELPLSFEYKEMPSSSEGMAFVLIHGASHAGFEISGDIGWKSIILRFSPLDFSKILVSQLAEHTNEITHTPASLIKEIESLKGVLVVESDDAKTRVRPDQPWPKINNSLKIMATYSPVDIRDAGGKLVGSAIEPLVSTFAKLLRELLPLEFVDDLIDEDSLQGVPEGARVTVIADRYERSRSNRIACLKYHGFKCKVCEFDFGATYGSIGEGSIQVHHILPISKFDGPRLVDPRVDLIPLCANCHMMIHRRFPPFSPDELRNILSEAKGRL